jgi:uncharacterized membrane protein
LIIGFILVGAHNLLDKINFEANTFGSFLWALCHQVHLFHIGDIHILVLYAALPWIGLMAIGYSMGEIFTSAISKEYRSNFLATAGLSCVSLFLILRMTNFYGNPSPWSKQPSASFTFLSFMNVTKYPPSLDYLLITVGIGLLILAFTERPLGRLGKTISVYGRVPLFFYVIHLYTIHLLAIIVGICQGFKWTDMVGLSGLLSSASVPVLKTYGLSLGGTYLMWIIIVSALYPLCKWYDRYKTNHKEKWWLSYL